MDGKLSPFAWPGIFWFHPHMKSVALSRIVSECARLLPPGAFQDWDGAENGLQIENDGRVTRIAAAVDASLAILRRATAMRADLLLVHHGLFWSPAQPWTGARYRQLQLLLGANLAVYSSHLPLDAQPRLGNNAQLCAALGFRRLKPFFFDRGGWLGFRTETRESRESLVERLSKVLDHPVKLLAGGPPTCRRIGVVTGGAGAELRLAAAEGVDTFITGEGPHWTHATAEELGLNVLYGGHYATETFGVKALAEHLSTKFKLPWSFIDHPSGL
jgi:dinuclear metal center YbgI/SA1388 family protein